MKLLISAHHFRPPFIGGVDVYADRLGRSLQRLGQQVAYLAVDGSVEGPEDEIRLYEDKTGDRKIWRLDFQFASRSVDAFALGYDEKMVRWVRKALEAEKPDVFVITNFYMLTLAAVEAADALGIPVVHVATDFLPVCRRATLIRGSGENCETGESIKECASCFLSRRLAGKMTVQLMNMLPTNTVTALAGRGLNADGINPLRLVRPYWRQVDLMSRRLALLQPLREKVRVVFAPTRFTADSFIANGFPQDRVHIEPFGVEPGNALSRVSHEAADHVRFLAIARFQPYKGLHLLVEAFNRLEQPRGATLTIYGDSHGYDEYARQLRAAAAGNERIRFEGIVSPTELADVFARADAFVLPSTWHENSPLIVLDALQSGTPLIASDIGGVRDLVHHDKNGWLFPRGDAAALHGLICQAIEQPSRLYALRGRSDLQTIDAYSQRLLALSGQQVSMVRQAVSGIQGVTDH